MSYNYWQCQVVDENPFFLNTLDDVFSAKIIFCLLMNLERLSCICQ